MFEKIIRNVSEKTPLTHMITNYVTVNDCANILLACGGSPIMSDEITEVQEITSICSALCINIGTLNSRTIESMLAAGERANELRHPVVLDPVGAGASSLRTETTFRLMEKVRFSVIRGNASEIKTIAKGSGSTKGVDANLADAVSEDNLGEAVAFIKAMAEKTGAVIAMTGAIDLVGDDSRVYVIRNGHPMMSKVSGTGCMLSGLIAAYCGANPDDILEAASAAVCAMGLCGERAAARLKGANGGTASLRSFIIDEMSLLDETVLNGGAKVEIR